MAVRIISTASETSIPLPPSPSPVVEESVVDEVESVVDDVESVVDDVDDLELVVEVEVEVVLSSYTKSILLVSRDVGAAGEGASEK